MADSTALPWTGERLVPDHAGDTALEHLHRYAFAREYVRDKDVLDIACGEGYGSHLLSDVAASVIGVDISADVVAHARRKYGNGDRVTFKEGACTAIPLPDASVDAVASFETLEHIAEHEAMLQEVKRVLRPGGVLILSTPDKLYCTDIPKNYNPFHVRELYEAEFRYLLGAFFAHVSMFQQRICHASVVAPALGLPVAGFGYYLGDFRRLEHMEGIRAPLFNLAVATDADTELPHNVSLFQGWNIPTEVEKQAAEERAAHAATSEELAILRRQAAEEKTAHAAATEELTILRRRFAKLQRPLPDARILALGIVTYNNPATQLARLVQSIDRAAEQCSDAQDTARLYSIDCGSPSEWVVAGIAHYCIVPDGNLGFGRGMNRLMARAFADPQVLGFLCVNPDGIMHRDLLAEVLRCAEQYPDSLIEVRQFPEEHPKPYDPDTGLTAWASGACMLIPRKVYETIGGFDENIFMFMEDVDFSWRARSAGFTIHVAPRALFAHSVLDRKADPLIEKYYYFSARYLAHKWRKPTEQAFYEGVILERGYVSTLPPLPALDHPTAQVPVDTTVAEFKYGFAYAPVRWS